MSSREEIPHVQGKRNPNKTVGVAGGHQRADKMKPYSQKTSHSNHTRTTALSNSIKLSHARGATQDGQVMVERSDRMWSTGEGNGKLRESVPRQVDRESRGPQGERGLEVSRRKKGQAFFLSPHSLGLFNNNVSCLRTVFGFNLLLS